MPPDPIYKPDLLTQPAYQLRYNWTGWPSSEPLPPEPDPPFFTRLLQKWESDHIRVLEYQWSNDRVIMTTSVTPEVSPVTFTQKMKGRLQHELRNTGIPTKFSRKLAMRTVGEVRSDTIKQYILDQVEKEPLADASYKELLNEFTVYNESVNLSDPITTGSGRYWYNLHIVLVVRERHRISSRSTLETIRDQCFRIAAAQGYDLSAFSVLPDHLHVALRGKISDSPKQIALSFLNNLSYALGQNAIWEFSYYAGTFGEYDMNAIRSAVGQEL